MLISLLVIQLPYAVRQGRVDIWSLLDLEGNKQELQDVERITCLIPEGEYDTVYAYGMESCSRWYLQAGLFPDYRYHDWQEHYIELKPQIGIELVEWLEEAGARWIVTPADVVIKPSSIDNVIKKYYDIYEQTDAYVLYRAIEDK